jgi:cellobiose phosphorylase
MIHALTNGLFTRAGGEPSDDWRHLLGPRARLFDRPMAITAPSKYFQRAESSPGQEIGIVYPPIRYAEALWRYGAEGFFHACSQPHRHPRPSPRHPAKANCYYPLDAAFNDRYEAHAQYDRVIRGEIPLEGGWRIYSSGAGISMGLIMRCFLGLCQGQSIWTVDPVMPKSLDGMRVALDLAGHPFEVTYRIKGAGRGPTAVILNDVDLPFSRGRNPYRLGAAEVPMAAVRDRLMDGGNRLTINID